MCIAWQTFSVAVISEKIFYAKELLEKLKEKSADLDWKVCEVQEVVENFKCGFEKLEEDVSLLEGASAEVMSLESEFNPELDRHDDESEDEFEELLNLLEVKKDAVEVVAEFAHPCGGPGWELVEYRDFRLAGTVCYPELTPFTSPRYEHLCGIGDTGTGVCSTVEIHVYGNYNAVCGRIKAYQYGTGNAFESGAAGINEPYLTGISLTHGGSLGDTIADATHIWSFAVGQTQFQMIGGGAVDTGASCPCDGGDPSPSFVGEDYFCDSRIITDISGDPSMFDTTFFNRKPLWNGEGCIESSQCCSRIDHPYFVKNLSPEAEDPIDLRVCVTDDITVENVLLELIELYVQYVP